MRLAIDDCYTGRFFPCLTDKRLPNAPPVALPALRRTPRRGGLAVDDGNQTHDRSDYNI
jgi:hypothetical protein